VKRCCRWPCAKSTDAVESDIDAQRRGQRLLLQPQPLPARAKITAFIPSCRPMQAPATLALPPIALPAAAPAPTPDDQARRQRLQEVFGAPFAARWSGPVLLLPAQVLSSPVVRRLWARDFAWISRQLHLEERFRGWPRFDTALLDEFARRIRKKQDSVDLQLSERCAQMDKLLAGHASAAGAALWPAPLVVDVPILCRTAARHFELLQRLDRLLLLSGTCGLLGLLPSTDRIAIERSCRGAFRGFHSLLLQDSRGLYRHAQGLLDARGAA